MAPINLAIFAGEAGAGKTVDHPWVSDPDGVEWEVYNLNHDVDKEASAGGAESTCCTPLARIGKRAQGR